MLKTSKFIAHLTCYINVALAYVHQGFELGHDESAALQISGGSGYSLLARHYTIIFLLLFLYLLGKAIKKEIMSNVLCVSALFLILLQYQTIYLQKKLFFSSYDSFTKLMRETITVDWISFSLIMILLILQFVTAYQDYFKLVQAKTKIE